MPIKALERFKNSYSQSRKNVYEGRMRKALSLDLRERILACYDRGEATREAVARRFSVSLGMVKKLIQQRRHTGEVGARYHRCGRKPMIEGKHRQKLRELLEGKADMTLEQLRDGLGLSCTPQAIHYVLEKMGMTYKKRQCVPASRTGPISRKRDAGGNGGREALPHRGLSSSTSRRRKRT